MSGEPKARVALVTGGSRGIGRATAIALAKEGVDVAITYHASSQAADEVVKEIRSLGRKAEAIAANALEPARVADAVRQVATQWGRLDILVNNAGVFEVLPIDQADDGHYDRQFKVNVESVFRAMREAAAHLPAGGRIINIGTALSDRTPMPGISVYTATKMAVVGLTKGAARDLGARGITVNCVQPGPIDTDMNPATGEFSGYQKSLTAVGQYGSAEDIARAVAFLASPAASNITGAVFTVDGGFSA